MTFEKKVELKKNMLPIFLYYAQLNLSVYRQAVINLSEITLTEIWLS